MFPENKTADEIRAKREVIKKEFGLLFDALSEILFRHDPIGINFETNTDEYEPEVGTILPRLRMCRSGSDVRTAVHEEFQKWFSGDAGPIENYQEIAAEIWDVWSKSASHRR